MKKPYSLFLLPFLLLCFFPNVSSQTSSDKLTCVRSVFKDTMNNLTVFSNDQLESFQNISPEVKKKVKTAIMDILSSLGLVLEVSTVPTVSLAMLPVYLLRAKNLIILLERDLENLKPESDSLSTSLEPIKKGVMAVVQNMPMKAAKCFYNSEL